MSSKPANLERKAPSPLGVWINHHLQSMVFSLGRALRKPWTTLLTVMVMALALALPLGLSIALDNLKYFSGSVQQSRDISLFLIPEVAGAEVEALASSLRARTDVAAITVKTPEQGLAELRQSAGLGEAIDALGSNPLPSLLVITPALEDDAALISDLEALPQADQVQHDAVWRKRLDGWLGFGARLVQVLSLLLGVGAALVVGNTVRLDIQARREEIGVLQLLGASDGFIRRPFVYLGAWYGLGAGAVALALIGLCGVALRAPLTELSLSYGSVFVLHGLGMFHSVMLLIGTTILGWLGAWLVAGYFLRQTRPTET